VQFVPTFAQVKHYEEQAWHVTKSLSKNVPLAQLGTQVLSTL
jgi:hypothetical protein